MKILQVKLGQGGYRILIGDNLLSDLGKYLQSLQIGRRILVVTNDTVGPIYGNVVLKSIKSAGYEVVYEELPDGEIYKTLDSAKELYTAALSAHLGRECAVVALGGGVIGDLAGFVAATYMRGVPFIQVPTTLLSQVDSSIGGKVAVNHPLGKNMIGSFYQPLLVLADVGTLRSLPVREVRSGLGEVIKHGVIANADFFDFLEIHLDKILDLDPDLLTEVIDTAARIKVEIVEKDEKEHGQRALLNFGHTIGHALETLTDYQVYRHGEAVAAGMAVAATMAENLGLMSDTDRVRLIALLDRAGLPISFACAVDEIIKILPRDKKAAAGHPRFVLPSEVGHAAVYDDIEAGVVKAALEKNHRQS